MWSMQQPDVSVNHFHRIVVKLTWNCSTVDAVVHVGVGAWVKMCAVVYIYVLEAVCVCTCVGPCVCIDITNSVASVLNFLFSFKCRSLCHYTLTFALQHGNIPPIHSWSSHLVRIKCTKGILQAFGLSLKFCSGENFVPGPIFRKNCSNSEQNFQKKWTGAKNFVPGKVLHWYCRSFVYYRSLILSFVLYWYYHLSIKCYGTVYL